MLVDNHAWHFFHASMPMTVLPFLCGTGATRGAALTPRPNFERATEQAGGNTTLSPLPTQTFGGLFARGGTEKTQMQCQMC